MPFPGTNLPPNQWDPTTIGDMKQFLANMYHANEWATLPDPYRFSDAGGRSSWSFGQAQWDVGQMLIADGAGTLRFFHGLGFTDTQIQQLAKNPVFPALTKADVEGYTDRSGVVHPGLNDKLRTPEAIDAINRKFEGKLNDDIALMRNVYATLRAAGPGSTGAQTAQYMVEHPVTFVMAADFNNQIGLNLTGPGALLMQYMRGTRVTLGDPDHPSLHDVTISLADNHPGETNPQFTIADYVWFYMNTWQARKSPADGLRQANRLLYDLQEFHGPNFPDLTPAQVTALQRLFGQMASLGPDAPRLPLMPAIRQQLLGKTSDVVPGDMLQAAYADWRDAQAQVVSLPVTYWNTGSAPWAAVIDLGRYGFNDISYAAHIMNVAPYPGGGGYWELGFAELVPGFWGWNWTTRVGYSGSVSSSIAAFFESINYSIPVPGLAPPSGPSFQALLAYLDAALHYVAANGFSSILSFPGVLPQMEQLQPFIQQITTYPWPGGAGQLPYSILDAAKDSRWASIAPFVAQQVASRLGLATSQGGPTPTLLVNTESGIQPVTVGGVPFLDTEWVAPGDGILVWDPSTLRSQTADAPGETVVAFAPNTTLDGTPGNDVLWAGPGSDTLIGGPGDVLHGGSGNDTFVLGQNDVAFGGPGANTFEVALGSGQTTIYAGSGKNDPIRFGPDIAPDDVRIVPRGWTDDLVLEISKSGDQVTLRDWYETFAAEGPRAGLDPYQEHPGWGTRVAQVEFADGTVWDAATLRRKSLVADAPGEAIVGFNTDDTLAGRHPHDELWTGAGNDTLIGGPEDVLHGGSGNDVFVSGRNNLIDAGSGINTVKFGRADGHDTLNTTAGGTTTLALEEGIAPLDLTFALEPNGMGGNDLQVSVHDRAQDSDGGDGAQAAGDGDFRHDRSAGISVTDWEATVGTSGAHPPVATFETKHAELAGTDVGPLIQAMATFTADTGLSWDQAIEQRGGDVEAILSRYWHPVGRQPSGEDGGDLGDRGGHERGWSR
ncbi:MAG TPA: calcium-binding protein [bacterium]|nr:calcium-binding protein [bacterium]